MCLVNKITFTTCGHTKYLLVKACHRGFSRKSNTCNAKCEQINVCLPSANRPYCRFCYQRGVDAICYDYCGMQAQLIQEVQSLGWDNRDIGGSLLEIQIEGDDVLAEWKASCGRTDQTRLALDPQRTLTCGPCSSSMQLGDMANLHAGSCSMDSLHCTNRKQMRDFQTWQAKKGADGLLTLGHLEIECDGCLRKQSRTRDKLIKTEAIDCRRKNVETYMKDWRIEGGGSQQSSED